jgi:hypothetical protein
MVLKEILQKIIEHKDPILLCDSENNWTAEILLTTLSPIKLNRPAYFQTGLYIAEINDAGYLGRVLYKIKPA